MKDKHCCIIVKLFYIGPKRN